MAQGFTSKAYGQYGRFVVIAFPDDQTKRRAEIFVNQQLRHALFNRLLLVVTMTAPRPV